MCVYASRLLARRAMIWMWKCVCVCEIISSSAREFHSNLKSSSSSFPSKVSADATRPMANWTDCFFRNHTHCSGSELNAAKHDANLCPNVIAERAKLERGFKQVQPNGPTSKPVVNGKWFDFKWTIHDSTRARSMQAPSMNRQMKRRIINCKHSIINWTGREHLNQSQRTEPDRPVVATDRRTINRLEKRPNNYQRVANEWLLTEQRSANSPD